MSISEAQHIATAIAPKITASLSIMGSIFIITDILKSKEKMGRTYSRILLVMSIYDFLTSIAQGLSTWPIPQGSGRVYAAGTTFTCSFQGFFTQLGVGAPMYNCSLSFYYLVVIAFAFTEERVKEFEWFMHGIPLVFSIGTAVAGLPLTLYNNAYLWCWIAALPNDCENGTNQGGEGPCQRGHYAWVFRWAIYYGPVWFCVLTITLNMAVVSYLVWAKEKASLRFRFGHRSNPATSTASSAGSAELDPSTSFGGTPSVTSPSVNESVAGHIKSGKSLAAYFAKKRAKKQKQKQRQGLASQVFWQAFYYVLGFYITWIFPTILRMKQTLGKPVPYWILLAMSILLPLQGFFNFLVYVRPRVVQYQNRHPEKSLCAAISRALRRTVNVLYISESRAFNETEIQDIETLDPCYALQVEKTQEMEESKKRKSGGLSGRSNIYGDGGSGLDKPFGSSDMEKAPGSRDSLEQRRLDELKLLEQEDPTFYEGQESSRNDFPAGATDESKDNMSESTKDISHRSKGTSERNNKDESFESAPGELWDRPREVAKAVIEEEQGKTNKPSIEVVAVERAPDLQEEEESTRSEAGGEERMQITKSNSQEEVNAVSDYPALKSSQIYFYPEFSGDPDFYFI